MSVDTITEEILNASLAGVVKQRKRHFFARAFPQLFVKATTRAVRPDVDG